MKRLLTLIAIMLLLVSCTESPPGSPAPVETGTYGIAANNPGNLSKFAVFGDLQRGYDDSFANAVNEAEGFNAQVALYVGDVIDGESNWVDFDRRAPQIPTIVAPGNHEYTSGAKMSPNWRKVFDFPLNGPQVTVSDDICGQIHQRAQIQAAKNTVYTAEYNNVRFIILNSMTREARQDIQGNVQELQANGCSASEAPYDYWLELQREWLEDVMQPNKFNIVTFHHSMIGSAGGRDSTHLREGWADVLSEADIVFTGHDHVYTRGEYQGTPYVSLNTGRKYYPFSNVDWNRANTSPITLVERQSMVGLVSVDRCLNVQIVNIDTKVVADSIEVC